MNRQFRLTDKDLLLALEDWDTNLRTKVLVVACGGTALTLNKYKESTKDVDFLIPNPRHFISIVRMLPSLGYKQYRSNEFIHPDQPWLFQLYQGQTIFQTALLDPVHETDRHKVIRQYKRLTLAGLNSLDLIISKMFRGDGVDVDDSVCLIQNESLDLAYLGQRYQETAGYYYNPGSCKKNLQYLIKALDQANIDPMPLKEVYEKWIP